MSVSCGCHSMPFRITLEPRSRETPVSGICGLCSLESSILKQSYGEKERKRKGGKEKDLWDLLARVLLEGAYYYLSTLTIRFPIFSTLHYC